MRVLLWSGEKKMDLARLIKKLPIIGTLLMVFADPTQIRFRDNEDGDGFIGAVVMLLGVMFATVIGAIVFFNFINNITGTDDDTNDTIDKVKTYSLVVFGMLALVPLILIGGLMLRSLGFFGGGGGI